MALLRDDGKCRGLARLWRQRRQMLADARIRTMIAVNLASIIERADEQVLPAMYSYVGKAFNATPEKLGVLTFCRAVTQALASPLAGFAGYRRDRPSVVAFGCLIWGLATIVFGFSTNVAEGRLLWAINGVGLALVIPSLQSLTADYFLEDSRGKAFGVLFCTSAVGAMAGQLYATNFGGEKVWGFDGWRFVMVSVGLYSLLIGLVIVCIGKDPRNSTRVARRERRESQDDGEIHDMDDNNISRNEGKGLGCSRADWAAVLKIMKVPTFVIIIVQGVFGSFPWQALVYMTHYLQLLGMTDFASSLVVSLFHISTAFGGVLGGVLGDHFGKKYPNHGRIFTCQFSVGIKLPLVVILLRVLPRNGEIPTVFLYGFLMIIMGVLAPWAAAACNNPIFAEIVPASQRNMIYGFDRSFEGALAALGAPLVGILSERFGYQGSVQVTGDPNIDLPNAKALGNALFFWLMVPWSLCLFFYSFVHFTYPRDRVKQRSYVLLSDSDSDGSELDMTAIGGSSNQLVVRNEVQL